MNHRVVKKPSGEVVIIIDEQQPKVWYNYIDGKVSIEIEIPLSRFCKIEDSVDKLIYEKTGLASKNIKTVVPPMDKEEFHDLFFGLAWEDGTDITKALTIKLTRIIDEELGKGNYITFGELLEKYSELFFRK